MYTVSNNYKNYIKMPSRTINSRLEINSSIYTDSEIIDMSLESNLVPGEEFTLGCTVCNKYEATVKTNDNIIDLSVVKPYILLYTDTWEEVPLGIFTIDDVNGKKDIKKIIAYDNMIKLEKAYFSDLVYPATIQEVANEIGQKAGVSFMSVLPIYTIDKIEGKTLREAIGIIAGICGGFARVNRLGNLEIVGLTSTGISITSDNFFNLEKAETNFTIKKVTAVKEDKSIVTAGTGLASEEITFSNNFINQTMINNILNSYNNFSYRPIKLNYQGDPAMDVGDKVTITDTDNVTYEIPVMRLKLTYKGGIRSEISSIAKSKGKTEYDYKGPLSKKIEVLVVDQANIKVLLAEKATIEDLTVVNARIDNLVVTTAMIQDAAITNAKIANLAVDTAKIADAAITNVKIGLAAIDTANIKTGSITNALIGAAAIQTANIASGTITNALISDATITAAKIVNSTITNAQIANATITAAKIANATITSAQIASATITSANIQDGTIVNADIANATITGAKIANATIGTANIIDANITTAKIVDTAITNAKIANLAVGTSQIQDAAITNAKIEALAVDSAKIADASITNAKIDRASVNKLVVSSADIADSAIVNAKIANASIDNAKIATLAVATGNIQDAAITNAKIGSLAVSSAQIQDAAITSAKIADATIVNADIANATITGAKIANATITNANIANATIGTAQIANGAITTALIGTAAIGTTQIADGSITDAKIVGLTANKITAGTIDASIITVTNLRADNIVAGSLTIDGDNLIHNTEWVNDTSTWLLSTGWVRDTSVKYFGSNTMKQSQTGSAADTWYPLNSEKFYCSPGEKLVASVYAMSDNIVGLDRGAAMEIDFYDANDARIGLPSISFSWGASNIWGKFVAVGTAPTNTSYARVRIHVTRNGNLWVARPMLQRGSIATEWKSHTDEQISNGAITTTQIASGTILGSNIANGTITNTLIAADTITGDKIVADAITAREIAASTITANEIAGNTITAAKMVAGTITAASGVIADAAIVTAKIADSAITAAKILDATITNAEIANATITGAKIALATIATANIADAAITTAKIGSAQITTALIADANITNAKIAALAVDAAKIADATITAGKIVDATITGAKIANASITAAHIVDATIGTAEIADAAITNAKISAVDAVKITTGTLDANRIGANTITADKVRIGDYTNLALYNPDGLTGGMTVITHTDNYKYFKIGAFAYASIKFATAAAAEFKMNDEYYFSFTGFRDAASMGATFIIRYYYSDSTYSNAGTSSISIGTTNSLIEGTVKITATPTAGKTLTRVDFFIEKGNEATAYYYLKNLELRKRYSGVLIVDGSITAAELAANTITASSGVIANAAITTAMIADANITSAKIADASITSAKIADATIVAADIANATITGAKIANATITNANIANATIGTAQIANLAVTTALIADGAITTAKIGSAQITDALIADATITSAKIANLDAGKITAGTISAARIGAGAITVDKLASNVGASLDISSNTSITSRVTADAMNSAINQSASDVTIKFSSSGGHNLLKNAEGKNGTTYWNPMSYAPNGSTVSGINFVIRSGDEWILAGKKAIQLQAYQAINGGSCRFEQQIPTTVGKTYTLTGLIAGHRSNKYVYARRTNGSWTWLNSVSYGSIYGNQSLSGWEKINLTFTAQDTTTDIVFEMTTQSNDGYIWLIEPMVSEGSVGRAFSPHASEIYSGNTTIDAGGVKVWNGGFEAYNNSGQRIMYTDTSGLIGSDRGLVSYTNGSGTHYTGENIYKVPNGQPLYLLTDNNIHVKTATIGGQANGWMDVHLRQIKFGVTDQTSGWYNRAFVGAANNHIHGLIFYDDLRGSKFDIEAAQGRFTDLQVSGNKNCIVQTTNFGSRAINAYETAEYYFGDIGSGKIVNGECIISIDDIFYETVNTNIPYHVFVQKYGRGDIWIEDRQPSYFIVKGTEGLEFSWELKAKRKGYENNRLEVMDYKTENYTTEVEENVQNSLNSRVFEVETDSILNNVDSEVSNYENTY